MPSTMIYLAHISLNEPFELLLGEPYVGAKKHNHAVSQKIVSRKLCDVTEFPQLCGILLLLIASLPLQFY